MLKNQWITIGLIVVLAAMAIHFYREYHRANKNLAAVQPDYTVQATTLVNEFLSNDAVALDKYCNKILVVQGIIKSVERVEDDCTIVLGDTTGQPASVRCLLDSTQVKQAIVLRRGDPITIKGAITGFNKDDTGLLGSDVELNRCVLVEKLVIRDKWEGESELGFYNKIEKK
jgi:hypothetical protein